jgi:hypothetical protein
MATRGLELTSQKDGKFHGKSGSVIGFFQKYVIFWDGCFIDMSIFLTEKSHDQNLKHPPGEEMSWHLPVN